jgi:hypothetical protein
MLGHNLLLGPLGTEETMKRQWNVRREAVERPDAQDRLDRAYQSLLRWSLENERGHERTRAPSANGKKEEYHEGGSLRTEEKLSKNRSSQGGKSCGSRRQAHPLRTM